MLTAGVVPETATNRDIVWKSSDNTVATVDTNGTVKGIGVGRTIITAEAGGMNDTCEVTVAPASSTNYLSGCYIFFEDGTSDQVEGECYGTPCAIIPDSVINLYMANSYDHCVLEPITTDEDNHYDIIENGEYVSDNEPYFISMPEPGTKTFTVLTRPAEGERRSYTVNITRKPNIIGVTSVAPQQ